MASRMSKSETSPVEQEDSVVNLAGHHSDLIVVNQQGSTALTRNRLRKKDDDMRINCVNGKESIQDDRKRWELNSHDIGVPVSSRDDAKNSANHPRKAKDSRKKYGNVDKSKTMLPTPPPKPRVR